MASMRRVSEGPYPVDVIHEISSDDGAVDLLCRGRCGERCRSAGGHGSGARAARVAPRQERVALWQLLGWS
ncbi:hypothetical protein CEXT_771291 [Caerostris extrusa]|uniref:Uncharacterized protein n=1 Tax=Caerostris extrusa TaxID=172846 RepID=A0AAV4YAS8_CAEEX|nr:hypothetical protein CEXT_771291 [Caerostris extrusa]